MALLKCTECGKEVSSKASTCPNCGAPVKASKVGCIGKFFIGLLLLFLVSLFVPKLEQPKQAGQQQRAAEDAELNTKIEKFKRWALQNTAVTDIAINGKITMFVTLSSEKYTNRDNVRVIAETLARSYANQVGIDYAVCHVYFGNEEYAEGSFRR